MAFIGRLRWIMAAAIALASVAAPAASADLKAFNAAVRAGDYKAAAAEAKATWPGFDKTSADAAIVAREFGFASLVAGDNEQARQFGTFLMEQGATLSRPDDQPLTSTVLFRAADFRLKRSDRERSALRDALVARNGAPGVDMTSVLSWELLYVADWDAGDWANTIAAANAAAGFFAREKTMLARQRTAELHAASALFASSRGRSTQGRNDLYTTMADVHDRIVRDLDAATSQPARDQFWPLKWRAEAWAIAIASFLSSSYEQVGSNISTALNARALANPKYAQFPEDASAQLPVCDGQFEGKKLQYPESKQHQGVGSLITRIETAADGKVVSVEALAAVPDERFSENLIKTMKTWTFKPDPDVKPGSCRLNSRNHYSKVSFRIL